MKRVMGVLGTSAALASAMGPSLEAQLAPPVLETLVAEARVSAEETLDRVPGLAIAVGVGDRLVWAEGFGWADLELGTPVDTSTVFRVFSLSKAITGVVLMRLAEQGRIDLDAPISGLVAGLPTAVGASTPRQLAGHIGGIRHYRDGEAWNQTYCATTVEAVDIFSRDAAINEPGSTFLYSSWGYALLSHVLSVVSGSPFGDLVMAEVLEPVGMPSTSLGGEAAPAATATFYERRGWFRKRNHPAEDVDISCKWGGGAFLSSPVDIARMGMALMSGSLLGAEATEVYFAGMRTSRGQETNYGMGLGVTTLEDGTTRHTHTGSGIGGRSALILSPAHGLVVVATANNREEAIVDLAAEVAGAFIEVLGDPNVPDPGP